jgi:hypothetical protein
MRPATYTEMTYKTGYRMTSKYGAPRAIGKEKQAADTAWVLAIALVVALLHIVTNNRYGPHRDELQFLSDALHLDWGFVAYPPMTPFLERIGLSLFGFSLVGLRLFSVIAQSIAIVVTGWMARELGGGRLAQVTAALMIALSALPLFEGTEFQYSSFDYLWWVLIAYYVIRLLKTDNPRWWLAIGAVIGLGLMTKYSICFYIAGLLSGFLLSRARRLLWNWWFPVGVTLALLIFLPNFLWQVHHDFISIHFLQHIHKRDVGEGRANGFLVGQIKICVNLFAAPVCVFGLVNFFRGPRYRVLAWMYVVPLALFFFGKGRHYYLAAAYPMLMAMGAVAGERWLATLSVAWRRLVEGVFFTGLFAYGMLMCAILIPLANSGPLQAFALRNNGDLREEFGWSELVKTVAGIRDSLAPEQRGSVGIITANYGEQGAVELLGPAYRLPRPIGITNSAWFRGYPSPPPSTLIVIGFSREDANAAFTGCRWAGHNGNLKGIKNEESQDHPDIFVCGGPRLPWAEFWKQYQSFG